MDKKMQLRRGLEQKLIKPNSRFTLTREEMRKGMAMQVTVKKTRGVATHTVDIRGPQKTGFTVNKYTLVRPGDRVIFHNHTKGRAFIQFQLDTIFGATPLEVGPAATLTRTVFKRAPIGHFTFAVFCLAGPAFAVANSEPIIIINPKDDR